MTSFYHVIARYMRMTCRARAGVNVIEMSEPSTGDREVSEQGCKAQITHVIFDCDGLMLGRLAKLLILHHSWIIHASLGNKTVIINDRTLASICCMVFIPTLTQP